MLRTAILAAILALLALSGCESNAPGTNADQEVIALERSALDKWAQANPNGYIDIGADDVTWYDFNPGSQLRIDGLEAVRRLLEPLAQEIPHHTYELADPKVQIYGSTAILTFHWIGTTTEGQALPKWKVTSVYSRNNGKWRMVHAHWSNVQGV
ncbi:MAG: nuclear transport factor 2 family protein [Acidobacteria bacterium]|nr:nuclear transport factor 2 family protein [Acidobacteriota bacterium]